MAKLDSLGKKPQGSRHRFPADVLVDQTVGQRSGGQAAEPPVVQHESKAPEASRSDGVGDPVVATQADFAMRDGRSRRAIATPIQLRFPVKPTRRSVPITTVGGRPIAELS